MDQQQPPTSPPPPPAPQPWEAPVEMLGPAPGIRFAGHGARLVAYIVDAIILGVGLTVLFVVFVGIVIGGLGPEGDLSPGAAGGFFLLLIVAIVVSLAYFPYFWWRGGATPGMRMFRLRVVRDADGGPISGGQAVMRLVGYWINQIVFYIGFAWILVDKRRRGWHDLIAGTCVIEAP